MSDNLKVAKECGTFKSAEERLASQQAAHAAEIAKLKEERDVARTRGGELLIELSTANERIAYLEGLVAVKDDAIARARGVFAETLPTDNPRWTDMNAMDDALAISSSAETVQAFRDKLTEPLRMEVAMWTAIAKGLSFGTDWNSGTHAKIYRPKMLAALNNTQATAQAYEQEVEARGAVKALEDAASTFEEQDEHLRIEGDVHVAAERLRKMAEELRTAG